MLEFVSYPKSGRTWIRYMLRLLELDRRLVFHHDGFEFNSPNRPAHNFDRLLRRNRLMAIDRAIYLTRNPGDLLVSLYHQVTGRFADVFDYRGTMSDFIRDDYFGARPLRQFNVMWADISNHPKVMVLAYEQFQADPFQSLTRLLRHLQLPVDRALVREAVIGSEFETMRLLELSGAFPEPWLRPRNGAPKVRAGRTGAYRTVLQADDLRYLESIFPELESSVAGG